MRNINFYPGGKFFETGRKSFSESRIYPDKVKVSVFQKPMVVFMNKN
jgi:hypothetical protein